MFIYLTLYIRNNDINLSDMLLVGGNDATTSKFSTHTHSRLGRKNPPYASN